MQCTTICGIFKCASIFTAVGDGVLLPDLQSGGWPLVESPCLGACLLT
jgi:hypothetical protein